MPVVIYTLLRAGKPSIVSDLEYIMDWRSPTLFRGEEAYYCTQVSSAVSFILGLDSSTLDVDEEAYHAKIQVVDAKLKQQKPSGGISGFFSGLAGRGGSAPPAAKSADATAPESTEVDGKEEFVMPGPVIKLNEEQWKRLTDAVWKTRDIGSNRDVEIKHAIRNNTLTMGHLQVVVMLVVHVAAQIHGRGHSLVEGNHMRQRTFQFVTGALTKL